MANNTVHPGPQDSSVLTRQYEHRTDAIWRSPEYDALLKCAHYEGKARKELILNTRVVENLKVTGFYGVAKMGPLYLDHSLITELVERWRPETHSFHLPIGEVIVTLQDVEVILGLRVDGDAVTGYFYHNIDYRVAHLQNLLGITRLPHLKKFNRNSIYIRMLEEQEEDKIENLDVATDIQISQYTRRFIMRILGGRLFPDISKNKVRLFFIDLLEDFNACGELSWGSAVLAWLYRNLCCASNYDKKNIGGCLIFLQLWAWERLPMCLPEGIWPLGTFLGPYGARWHHPYAFPNTSRHTLRAYREQLDRFQDDQFVWCPYPPAQSLPDYCSSGIQIYTCRVPLIFLFVVEWHFSDRVIRQFGGIENIPRDAGYDERLHKIRSDGWVVQVDDMHFTTGVVDFLIENSLFPGARVIFRHIGFFTFETFFFLMRDSEDIGSYTDGLIVQEFMMKVIIAKIPFFSNPWILITATSVYTSHKIKVKVKSSLPPTYTSNTLNASRASKYINMSHPEANEQFMYFINCASVFDVKMKLKLG